MLVWVVIGNKYMNRKIMIVVDYFFIDYLLFCCVLYLCIVFYVIFYNILISLLDNGFLFGYNVVIFSWN